MKFLTEALLVFVSDNSLLWNLSWALFRSIPGLYPLDVSRTPQLLQLKKSLDFSKCPKVGRMEVWDQGRKGLLWRTHGLLVLSCYSWRTGRKTSNNVHIWSQGYVKIVIYTLLGPSSWNTGNYVQLYFIFETECWKDFGNQDKDLLGTNYLDHLCCGYLLKEEKVLNAVS